MPDPGYPPTDVRRVHLRRLKAGSLLKLVLLANAMLHIPLLFLMLVFGTMGAFGAIAVRNNNEVVTGLSAFVSVLPVVPISYLASTVLFWVIAYLGIVAAGWVSPITLEYVPPEGEET